MLEEASMLRLVLVFLGAPPDATSVPEAPTVSLEERERAGEMLWDLTASPAADTLRKHVVEVAIANLADSRLGELSAGILANLNVADSRIGDAFLASQDPAVLSELVRWLSRRLEPRLVPKLEFIAVNSQDLGLLVRAFECAILNVGCLDATVWARAAVLALNDVDALAALPATTCASGLDAALRVLEVAHVEVDGAVDGLCRVLRGEHSMDELSSATCALASIAVELDEVTLRVPLLRVLEYTKDDDPTAADAAVALVTLLPPVAASPGEVRLLQGAIDRGIAVPPRLLS